MRTALRALGWALALCGSAWPVAASADTTLLSGLESSHVRISTGFTGQHIFVYGTASRAGDIVIRVTSPDEASALSRKGRVGPFWLKRGKLLVDRVPGLVYLLSNRPLEEIAGRAVLERHGLTFHATLAQAQVSGGPARAFQNWQSAFERLKQRQGLYRKLESDVHIEGGRLFSANFPLPATLPVGNYRLDIYSFRNGELVARHSSTLRVNEIGIERWVSRITLDYPVAFGILFTLAAALLGLAFSMLLRRDHARRP
ncbi:MAG: TIGR02186 family protein [Burkholderiales bacterium]